MNGLVIQHFSKRFGNVLVLDDISFEVQEGQTLGLLGRNGAGKTTIIRVSNSP